MNATPRSTNVRTTTNDLLNINPLANQGNFVKSYVNAKNKSTESDFVKSHSDVINTQSLFLQNYAKDVDVMMVKMKQMELELINAKANKDKDKFKDNNYQELEVLAKKYSDMEDSGKDPGIFSYDLKSAAEMKKRLKAMGRNVEIIEVND